MYDNNNKVYLLHLFNAHNLWLHVQLFIEKWLVIALPQLYMYANIRMYAYIRTYIMYIAT